jgi:DNA uptake protein ComE-like DNA-binding protein
MKVMNWLLGVGMLLAVAAAPAALAAQVGRNAGGVVYADVATRDDLVKLPHVTPALADALIAARPLADMLAVDRVFAALGADQKKELFARLFLPINLNSATRAEIMLVPGMGERMAREFEEYRPYQALAQFRREIGKYVSEEEVARFEQYAFVPIDLNTASDADILTIPGIGQRMLREFKEYRPYRNMEQFRREIGKYVGPKEVAQMERYVTIRP